MFVCVCVCVCERERETGRERGRDGDRDRLREREGGGEALRGREIITLTADRAKRICLPESSLQWQRSKFWKITSQRLVIVCAPSTVTCGCAFGGDCYPSCRCPLQLFRVVAICWQKERSAAVPRPTERLPHLQPLISGGRECLGVGCFEAVHSAVHSSPR